MDTGRFLLAIVLMIGVIIATNLLFPPIPSEPPAVSTDSTRVADGYLVENPTHVLFARRLDHGQTEPLDQARYGQRGRMAIGQREPLRREDAELRHLELAGEGVVRIAVVLVVGQRTAQREATGPVIEVTDTGPGIPQDAQEMHRLHNDPMAYIELWLSDAGEPADPHRIAAWLDWFDAQKVEAVGFGLVNLRHGGHDDPVVRVEDLRQPVEPPLGDQVAAWFDRQDWLRVRDTDALLAARYRTADGLRLRQEATLGEQGWGVERQVLTMPHGLRWSEEVDPLVLALLVPLISLLNLEDSSLLWQRLNENPDILDEAREHLAVVLLDAQQTRDLVGVVLVMRKRMESCRKTASCTYSGSIRIRSEVQSFSVKAASSSLNKS